MENSLEVDSTVSKLPHLMKALYTLTTPQERKASSKVGQEESGSSLLIDKVLEENLQALYDDIRKSSQLQRDLGDLKDLILQRHPHQSLLESKEVTVRKKHVEVNLCLLHEIYTVLYNALSHQKNVPKNKNGTTGAPELSPDALSAPQIKTLTLSLQFIVVMGICPYLSPGIGIPVSQRLGPGQILLATTCDYGAELSHLDRIQSLVSPVKLLCDMLKVPSLRDIVIANHLQDLLASLFQLRFSTKSMQNQNAGPTVPEYKNLVVVETTITADAVPVSRERCDDSGTLEEEFDHCENRTVPLPEVFFYSRNQRWTLPLVREHCNVYIDQAVKLSSTPHTLKTLMMLSGGGKSGGVSVPVKTPIWYKRTVAALLRDVLMVPNGIQHLIALLVSESPGGHEWQKCRAVAQVIAQLPTTSSNVQQFHKSVTNQLMAIIQSSSDALNTSAIRAVGATILELSNRQPALMDSVCFTPLFDPLFRISSSNDALTMFKGDIVVPETVLASCIECLFKLYVVGQEPQSSLVERLKKVVGVLFALHLAAKKSLSPLRSKCRDLISTYLSHCELSEAVVCILALLTGAEDHSDTTFPSLHREICFTAGQSGGIQALKQGQAEPQETTLDLWTEVVEGAMDILPGVKVDGLIPQLFICLLQKLTAIVKAEATAARLTAGDIELPPRLMNPSQKALRVSELREKICYISLLAAVGDKYGEGVVSSGGHVLEFAKTTLERCVQMCQACGDEATMSFEWETVSMAMGLLTAVLSGGLEVGDRSHLLDELLPSLNFLSESEAADHRVREMADDLKVAVATKGLVWAELGQMKGSSCNSKKDFQKQESSKTKQESKQKKIIEVLSETTLESDGEEKSAEQSAVNKQKDSNSGSRETSPLEQALLELCDPLLPVRGHGLIALARLVEERSPEVENKRDVLLKVFLENLTHTDSYIYLASINGLAALSDLCPDQIISCLTSELRSKCAQNRSPAARSSGDLVLKVGEAVVKATRRLGELTPKYRDPLLSSILCGCRHDDALTRASCLSGLAEVSQLLRFALGPVLYEVVTCCHDVISSDSDPQPRKAAAMTFTLLLRGLGRDTLIALDGALVDVYRILKSAVARDPDEGVRFHAALALEELDGIMREMLFAKPELSKRISILGLQ